MRMLQRLIDRIAEAAANEIDRRRAVEAAFEEPLTSDERVWALEIQVAALNEKLAAERARAAGEAQAYTKLARDYNMLKGQFEELVELDRRHQAQIRRAKAENTGPLEDALKEVAKERDHAVARAEALENSPVINRISGDYADLREHMRETQVLLGNVAGLIGMLTDVSPEVLEAAREKALRISAPGGVRAAPSAVYVDVKPADAEGHNGAAEQGNPGGDSAEERARPEGGLGDAPVENAAPEGHVPFPFEGCAARQIDLSGFRVPPDGPPAIVGAEGDPDLEVKKPKSRLRRRRDSPPRAAARSPDDTN
jgi:hypothetical protein